MINLEGSKFGRWSVIRYAGKSYQPMWECRCECGTIKLVAVSNLRSGASSGCGCQRGTIKHGHSTQKFRSKTYNAWRSMFDRCSPDYVQKSDYFDRGINVCDRWRDFEAFLSDMGEKPSEELSLDRIDNDRGYFPGNCRWATRTQQRHNCRNAYFINTVKGRMLLGDAIKLIGVSYAAIANEARRHGLDKQAAFDRVYARRAV